MADATVDGRGLSCPEPVLRAKRALDALQTGTATVLVDNPTARDNVLRLARTLGWTASCESGDEGFVLTLEKTRHA